MLSDTNWPAEEVGQFNISPLFNPPPPAPSPACLTQTNPHVSL